MMNGYSHHPEQGIDAGAWIGMGFLMLLLVVLAAFAVWMLTRDRAAPVAAPQRAAVQDREAPEELLRRRLAEGAITPDEYRARLAALREEDLPPPA